MDNHYSGNSERFKIGGIKLSPELVQFSCSYPPDKRKRFIAVLENLAARQINILYLSHETAGSKTTTTLCVEKDNQITVRNFFDAFVENSGELICKKSVGTLTLFPHRSSVSFLSSILFFFYKHNLQVYGLCTSISALSIITDYSELDRATAALQGIVELPENHAPFRQEFSVRQLGH